MKRYLPFVIVGVVALATLTSATILYRAKRPAVLTISQENAAKTEGPDAAHVRGNPAAAVTMEEFGDYQCPPCGMLNGLIKQLEKELDPHLRVIFRHFPLDNHVHARPAAAAAEAAGLQGKFWEMHDQLYQEQAVWMKATDVQTLFHSYAGMLGLDIERFKKDMQSEAVKARVDSDHKRGTSLGVKNTPTIFLNNTAVPPTDLNPERLRAIFTEAVKEKKPSS